MLTPTSDANSPNSLVLTKYHFVVTSRGYLCLFLKDMSLFPYCYICIILPTEDSEKTRAYYLFKELESMKAVSHLPQFPTLIGYVDSFPYQSIIMEYLAVDDACAATPVTLHQVLKKRPKLINSQIIKVMGLIKCV